MDVNHETPEDSVFYTREEDVQSNSNDLTFVLNSYLGPKGETKDIGSVGYRPAHAILAKHKKYRVCLGEIRDGKETIYSAWTKKPEGSNRKWSNALFYVITGLSRKTGSVHSRHGHWGNLKFEFNSEEDAQNAFNEINQIDRYLDVSDFQDRPTVVFYVLRDYRNDAGMMNVTLTHIE